MTEPPSTNNGKAPCTVKSAPFTLVSNSLSKCSSVILPKVTNSPTPALATTISILPFARPTVSYRRSRSSILVTSPWMPVTLSPIAFTASSSSLWRRPVMKTQAPSLTKSFAMARPIPSVPPVMTATFPRNLLIVFSAVTAGGLDPMAESADRLLLSPLLGKCYGRPAIAFALLVQATQARKQQMRRRDHDILVGELGQQLTPCRCSRSPVDVEDHRDLGMLQLDALCMDGVAPKQDLFSLRRKLIAGMSRGMTQQGDELHAVDDWLGAAKRVPLTGLDIRRCDGLRTLEERLRILRSLGCDLWRQPKVALSLRDVNLGIWEDAISIVTGQAADMIGVEVRDQNEVDLFRRIARAAEAARQAPECSPTPPGAGTRIDED